MRDCSNYNQTSKSTLIQASLEENARRHMENEQRITHADRSYLGFVNCSYRARERCHVCVRISLSKLASAIKIDRRPILCLECLSSPFLLWLINFDFGLRFPFFTHVLITHVGEKVEADQEHMLTAKNLISDGMSAAWGPWLSNNVFDAKKVCQSKRKTLSY